LIINERRSLKEAQIVAMRDSGESWASIAAASNITISACHYLYKKNTTGSVGASRPVVYDRTARQYHPCLLCHKEKLLGWHYCDRCRERLFALDAGRYTERD